MENPVTEIMVSMTVHDCRVCFSVMPRYFPTNQKPLSLTCDAVVAPDAMAITMSALCGSDSENDINSGDMMPAEVIMATVAEPCDIRMTKAKI